MRRQAVLSAERRVATIRTVEGSLAIVFYVVPLGGAGFGRLVPAHSAEVHQKIAEPANSTLEERWNADRSSLRHRNRLRKRTGHQDIHSRAYETKIKVDSSLESELDFIVTDRQGGVFAHYTAPN